MARHTTDALGAQTRQRALEKARKEALARIGCLDCGMSRHDLSNEQPRLKAEFLARHAKRTAAAADTAAA